MSDTVIIKRLRYLPCCTLGGMAFEDEFFSTMERPTRGNEPNVSCIPVGEYHLFPKYYYRGKYMAYEVLDVPGRTHILLHRGNYASDVQGCIAIGERVGINPYDGRMMVQNSTQAFRRMMDLFNKRDLMIRIGGV